MTTIGTSHWCRNHFHHVSASGVVRADFGAGGGPYYEKKIFLEKSAADIGSGCRLGPIAHFDDVEGSSGGNGGMISDECQSYWSGIANYCGAGYCNPDRIGADARSRWIGIAAFGSVGLASAKITHHCKVVHSLGTGRPASIAKRNHLLFYLVGLSSAASMACSIVDHFTTCSY